MIKKVSKSVRKPRNYLGLAALAVILAVLNVYAVKSLDVLGATGFFAFSLLVEIVLLTIVVYSLIKAFFLPNSVLLSLIQSALRGLRSDPYIIKLRRRDSGLLKWLTARLSLEKPYGLPLTAVLAIAGGFLFGFLGILQDVLFKDPLTRTDNRIANLIPSIRTTEQTRFFSFITSLANIETLAVLILLVGVLLWLRRRRIGAAIFVVVSVGAEASNYVIKHLVSRVRPDKGLSLIREDGYSFPSGHVMGATVVFGLLAYYIYRTTKSGLVKLAIIITFVTTVFLVALSRIYLGVHYPSDVMASALLGGFILSIVIGGIEIANSYHVVGITQTKIFDKKVSWLVPIMVIFALVAHPLFVKISPLTVTKPDMPLYALNQDTVKMLPLYSETLTGARMEPVSFIYVGSRDHIEKLFMNHGWHKSDPSTLANTLRAVAVGFQNKQYLNAPVTPSYLDAKPQDIAFQKPTDLNTLKERHHTRLWKTSYVLPDGRPIWVATASLDDGVEFTGPLKTPTHHINPNIDAERDYIEKSLQVPDNKLQVVDSQLGKNSSGDPFYTNGKAILVDLK